MYRYRHLSLTCDHYMWLSSLTIVHLSLTLIILTYYKYRSIITSDWALIIFLLTTARAPGHYRSFITHFDHSHSLSFIYHALWSFSRTTAHLSLTLIIRITHYRSFTCINYFDHSPSRESYNIAIGHLSLTLVILTHYRSFIN